MNKTIFVWILTFLLFLVILISLFWWLQFSVMFYPVKNIIWKPSIPYEDLLISITNASIINQSSSKLNQYISAWHFNNFKNSKTVLFCHGNSGNISHRHYIINFCHYLGLNLFLFDYRGYGLSSGIPTPSTICEDGIVAYRYLSSICNPDDIIVWGESLGGAVATHIASHEKCAYLLLMCTFSSLDDIVYFKDLPAWLARSIGLLLKIFINTLPSKDKILNVKCPIVIMHSKDDELIPYQCAEIMYGRITHPCKLFITIKGGHSTPEISEYQLLDLLSFCNIKYTDNVIQDKSFLEQWLSDLKTVAAKHLDIRR